MSPAPGCLAPAGKYVFPRLSVTVIVEGVGHPDTDTAMRLPAVTGNGRLAEIDDAPVVVLELLWMIDIVLVTLILATITPIELEASFPEVSLAMELSVWLPSGVPVVSQDME